MPPSILHDSPAAHDLLHSGGCAQKITITFKTTVSLCFLMKSELNLVRQMPHE